MKGLLVGAGFGLGCFLVVYGLIALRRPSLADRVLPFVRDLHIAQSDSTTGIDSFRIWGFQERWLTQLSELVSSSAGVERRMRRIGEPVDIRGFRMQQWAGAWLGLASALALSVVLWVGSGATAGPLLILCVVGFVGGMVAVDFMLSVRVRRTERLMTLEFPVLADLMSLAVASGLSPLSAMEHVIEIANGPLARKFGEVVAKARTGNRLEDALEELARESGLASVSRFALALAVAVERGTPLIEVLHAQAADVRDASRRELLESAGRREILMLAPVVFIVLPLVVIFSFYPGLVSLEFVNGS